MDEIKKTRILLIEDNTADAKLVELYLNESIIIDPEITRVVELKKGLLMLEETDFDAVLLDLTLPDSSGFDTLRTMLNEFPDQTVIVMTGLEDETVALNSVKAGAQDFIVKGQFDSTLLSRTITYAIERHQLQMKLENYAKAIKLNEQRLIEAQKMARIGNWELDIVTNQMYWSEEVYRILEITQDTDRIPLLNDYLKFVLSDDVAHVKAAINRTMEKGKPYMVNYKVILANGNEKYIANQGQIQLSKKTGGLCLVGTIQDITSFSSNESGKNINMQKILSHLQTISEKSNNEVKDLVKEILQELN